MITIYIWQLNEEIVRRLKCGATANDRSPESDTRHILERAAEDAAAEKHRGFRLLAEKFLIMEDRDVSIGLDDAGGI